LRQRTRARAHALVGWLSGRLDLSVRPCGRARGVAGVGVVYHAHHEFRLTNQTAQHLGFHSANMIIEQGREETMQDTVDAIYQLATATASDRGTVATLTTTNANLATQLKAAQAQIAQLKNEIAVLKNNIKPACQGQRPIKMTNNDSYCWSHGYQVAKSHTSATCNMKKSRHQDAANKSNPMGGVQRGKE
jgi:hypothetical protein